MITCLLFISSFNVSFADNRNFTNSNSVRTSRHTDALKGNRDYAIAIECDAAGRYFDAFYSYGLALNWISSINSKLLFSSADLHRFRGKILWEREAAKELIEHEAYADAFPSSAPAHFALGNAYLEKFLTVRAFLGRAPKELLEKTESEYLKTLDIDRSHAGAALGLARVYAGRGQLDEARRQLALLGTRVKNEHLMFSLAQYYAEIGERELALELLTTAINNKLVHKRVLNSNAFDSIRNDANFRVLIEK